MSDDLEKLKQLLDVDSPPKVSIDNVKKSSKRKIIKRSTYLISGIASVSASLLLFVVFFKNLILLSSNASLYGTSMVVFVIAAAFFCLLRGISTIVYHISTSRFDKNVYAFMINKAHNRLLITYEKMLWLWVLSPVFIICLTLLFNHFRCEAPTFVFCFTISLIYAVLLAIFSNRLWKEKKYWEKEISRLVEESK